MPGAPAPVAAGISPKSRLATTLLAWFLGYFGAHRFYIGKTGTAIVMLVLGIVGIPLCFVFVGIPIVIGVAVWALIDFIFAVAGKMTDSQGLLIEKW
jgi:TM2 domain-containing membrane protein YozV